MFVRGNRTTPPTEEAGGALQVEESLQTQFERAIGMDALGAIAHAREPVIAAMDEPWSFPFLQFVDQHVRESQHPSVKEDFLFDFAADARGPIGYEKAETIAADFFEPRGYAVQALDSPQRLKVQKDDKTLFVTFSRTLTTLHVSVLDLFPPRRSSP